MTEMEALDRAMAPRPDLVSVGSLLTVMEGRKGAALIEAQGRAWASVPGDTRAADTVVALLADVPAPFLRYLIGDFYEHVGAHGAGLTALNRAAAETPCWDTMLVAWAHNGIASALGLLGRHDEARAVLERLWALDPFYPNALETADQVGAPRPTVASPAGPASSLRLSVAQHLYEGNREPGQLATAMAMSLVWEGQHAAAASLAALALALPGVNPAWAGAIADHARDRAATEPGRLPALPVGSVAARRKALRVAVKAGELGMAEAAALDPDFGVAQEAWVALVEAGHRRDELEAIINDIAPAFGGRQRMTYRASQIVEVLDDAPLPSVSASALVERALQAIGQGALVSLPHDRPGELSGAPPSLAAWLRAGTLDELAPSMVIDLVRRAFGDAFDGLPLPLARSLAVPLQLPETVNERLELLVLVPGDPDDEAPILAFDVSEDPTASVMADSFGAWLAEDVGLGRLRPNDITRRWSKRLFGKQLWRAKVPTA